MSVGCVNRSADRSCRSADAVRLVA